MAQKILYPIGSQSFEKIRTEGKLYVDKTGFIPTLLDMGGFVFFSRPRRFGKSLFLSTLESYFRGQKELFEGLEISKVEKEWEEYPLIHLDLSIYASSSKPLLEALLVRRLKDIGKAYGLDMFGRNEIEGSIEDLIRNISEVTGKKVVVLVDEYDVPIHGLEENSEVFLKSRETLRSLFLQLKASDKYIKFCFVTGVARFNQVSIFSGGNNFKDLSMNPKFAELCGFSHEEVRKNCAEGIEQFADEEGVSFDTIFNRLIEHYDSYRFTKRDVKVFNPVSILNALLDKEFGNYWVSTGLTSVFVSKLMDPRFELSKITDEWVDDDKLMKIYDPADPISLMFQTGYLTIADYDNGLYKLRIPNREVMDSLTKNLIPAYTGKQDSDLSVKLKLIGQCLRSGNVKKMMGIVESIISSVAYHPHPDTKDETKEKENCYHTMMYFIFMMVSSNCFVEHPTSGGRTDMIAKTEKYVYIFEFKVDATPADALKQIEEKGYAKPYLHTGKQIIKLGIVFSSQTRSISAWDIDPHSYNE